jgi:hypothetical protein
MSMEYSHTDIRLGVFSNEKLKPWVNWTTLGPPLLKVLGARENARLIAPPPPSWRRWSEWRAVLKSLGPLDTLFWMQEGSRPELPVHIASLLCGRARRSAFVVDPWKYLISKIGTLAVVQHLDPCFIPMREAYEELKTHFPRGRFEWLPYGVDTTVFDSVPGERPVFAYWMGRRYEPLHQALLSYCVDRGLRYEYRRQEDEFLDPRELGILVGSSQYFLVTPPDLTDPARTGGFSPFVMRYFEGLAAGARLLGVLPRSGEYERLLPRDAILVVEADGSDLAKKLDADRTNLVAAREAVERARLFVRAHHSWTKRADQIYHRLVTGKPIEIGLQWSEKRMPS